MRPLILSIPLLSLPSADSRPIQPTPVTADASHSVELPVHVPAALAVARAIDTLSVSVDAAALGLTQVTAHAGMVTGIETDMSVLPQGRAKPVLERRPTSRVQTSPCAARRLTPSAKAFLYPAQSTSSRCSPPALRRTSPRHESGIRMQEPSRRCGRELRAKRRSKRQHNEAGACFTSSASSAKAARPLGFEPGYRMA
jgi:hypothetical protein